MSSHEVFCPYCQKKADKVRGDSIYPHRRDLHKLKFFKCEPCEAYVGCHKGKGFLPMGRLANKELRKLKQAAHAAFDPVWKSKGVSRSKAYLKLARALEITPEECHIGMFDEAMCRKTISICESGLDVSFRGQSV